MKKIKNWLNQHITFVKIALMTVKFISLYTVYFMLSSLLVNGAFGLASTKTTAEEVLQWASSLSLVLCVVIILVIVSKSVLNQWNTEDYFKQIFPYQSKLYFISTILIFIVFGIAGWEMKLFRNAQVLNQIRIIGICSLVSVACTVASNKIEKMQMSKRQFDTKEFVTIHKVLYEGNYFERYEHVIVSGIQLSPEIMDELINDLKQQPDQQELINKLKEFQSQMK